MTDAQVTRKVNASFEERLKDLEDQIPIRRILNSIYIRGTRKQFDIDEDQRYIETMVKKIMELRK